MSGTKPNGAFEALDVVSRARREVLGPEEARELERALATSALARAAHEVGRSFDAAGAVRAGDDTLIARTAGAVLATSPAPGRRARARWVLGVAATFVVATAAAASVAVVAAQRRGAAVGAAIPARWPRPLPAASHASRPTAHAPPPEHATRESRPTDAPSHSPEQTAGARATRAEHQSATPSDAARPPNALPSAPEPALASEPTAAELFRDASAARRAGELDRARALYVELGARYPHTSEARVSLVSLGSLLLASGRAGDAERAFDTYLKGGRGDLTEEALVGRAGALAALGRHAEERGAWLELIERFPASVYGARAKARLGTAPASDGTR